MNCVGECVKGAHIQTDGGHGLDYKLCVACGVCVSVCPNGALKITGAEIESGAVIDIVLRDAAYYRTSGGGMTLSGGEPMAQFDFALELLVMAKERRVHTCMETCGQADRRKYEQILPYTDVFLFDYKATDSAQHTEFTGVGNALILSNLDYLYHNGANIILRCPLIPGVNDIPEHLEGIAGLFRKYPNLLGIEIMPYHNLGLSKSKKLGFITELCIPETVTEETKQGWLDELNRLGCEKVKVHT
jgi:pyruvate formate lyase activating enzyme